MARFEPRKHTGSQCGIVLICSGARYRSWLVLFRHLAYCCAQVHATLRSHAILDRKQTVWWIGLRIARPTSKHELQKSCPNHTTSSLGTCSGESGERGGDGGSGGAPSVESFGHGGVRGDNETEIEFWCSVSPGESGGGGDQVYSE